MAPRVRPSLTARSVAAIRASVDRPAVPSGDPDGEDRLARSLRGPMPVWVPGMGEYIAARTQFFDEHLLAACASGAQQVVVVAAGYDARSVRFRQPGVVFFELDLPDTQADKLERLQELGVDVDEVRFVAVDLGHDSVPDALTGAGHDPARRTHFMCEGLTPYLPMPVLVRLVEALVTSAAPGSTLAIDFAEGGTGASRLPLDAVRVGTALLGERIVTFPSAEEVEALLAAAGWAGVELTRPSPLLPVLFAAASA